MLKIICAFAIQAGFSVLLALWTCILVYFWGPSAKSLEYINKMLVLINNIQLMTGTNFLSSCVLLTDRCLGIALLIAGIISQNQLLDLYHQHVVYDTVSFTG